jgi:hypothetical protein
MNLLEVKKILEKIFNKEPVEGKKRNIVFWYDDEGEFAQDIDELKLDNAKILKLTDNNSFYIKCLLEKEDTESNYLLYSPISKPMPRDNWLLDILKYSEEFSTDKAILIMRDFEVEDSSLRKVFKGYLKFFGNKERYKKFASFHIDKFTKEKVDIAVLSALCRLPVADFEQVVKKVLIEELEGENKYLEAIENFGNIDAFWDLVEKRYGYNYEERALEKLIIMLLITHLSYTLEEGMPTTWEEYVSPKRSDAIVFISNFMSHSTDGKYYDLLADRAQETLNVKGYLDKWDIDKYIECDTFRAFDEAIMDRIIGNLLEGIGEFDRYRKLINMAEIEVMQGVIPSTTKFGMASLLPGKNFVVDEKGEITVDDLNIQGTENRGKILANYSKDALAIGYYDMVDMKRQDYKAAFEGRKLIYIYHNVIDAVGDKPLTERNVFGAVEKAFKDLALLVKNLVNHVSATNIFITADHGFLYRRSPLTEVEKIGKHNIESIGAGRRHMLAETDTELDDALSISMKYLLGKETSLKALVPKGVIRYRVQGGGANYVHGGVSLQEITVPVIKFKNIRKDKYKATKVQVKLTNISRKITNRITYLEFFQTELVDEKKIPLKLKLYFVDEEGNRISNENIIIADSRSKNPENRTYREKFTLRDMAYDKNKEYYLILEDEDEAVEKIYERIPFTIDLLFSDDFGL